MLKDNLNREATQEFDEGGGGGVHMNRQPQPNYSPNRQTVSIKLLTGVSKG
jgi:hypothetical protein